jgi:hypothetical protein
MDDLKEAIQCFRDDDGDGVRNCGDNCAQTANPDQADRDQDGVGDACDQCDVRVACGDVVEGELSSPSIVDCDGGGYWGDTPYQQAVYDLVSPDGCGCKDPDGLDFFRKEAIRTEQFSAFWFGTYEAGMPLVSPEEWGALNEAIREGLVPLWRCSSTSMCTQQAEDRCLDADTVEEQVCTADGARTMTQRCPSGCTDGVCNCPDSDGGKDYFNKGTLSGVSDYCDQTTGELIEYFCSVDETPSPQSPCSPLPPQWGACERVPCEFGCDKDKRACICQDTDGGKVYEVKGTLGVEGTPGFHEDECLGGVWAKVMLREWYPVLEAGTCTAKSVVHTCLGSCQDGVCLDPTCYDGVQNQYEEGVDCGGPCKVDCGGENFMIHGRLMYEEADAPSGLSAPRAFSPQLFKPIREVKVELRENLHFGLVDAEMAGPDGWFEFVVPRKAEQQLYLSIQAQNYAANVEKDFDGCNEYVWWDSKVLQTPSTGNLDLGELKVMTKDDYPVGDFFGYWKGTEPSWKPWTWGCWGQEHHRLKDGNISQSAYFNIAETILVEREYAEDQKPNDDIGKVSVAYPETGGFIAGMSAGDTSWTNPVNGEIYLFEPVDENGFRDLGFADDVILHEYTHFLTDEISENDWAIVSHNWCVPITGAVENFPDISPGEAAFFEGFAQYMSELLINMHHDKAGFPYLSQEGRFGGGIEEPCGCTAADATCPALGANQEAAVAAVLWDLVDEPGADYRYSVDESSFDTTAGQDAYIFDIFDSDIEFIIDAPTICDFAKGFIDDQSQKDQFKPIAEHYNIHCSFEP